MLQDVIEARPLEGYRVILRFEDGIEGAVDLGQHIRFEGVFEPLRDRDYLLRLRVDRDAGTITWPNGADLDPDVLYSLVTGVPVSLGPERTAV